MTSKTHRPRAGFSHDVLNRGNARTRLQHARAHAALYHYGNRPRTWRDAFRRMDVIGHAHGIGEQLARAIAERTGYVSAPVELVDAWRDVGDAPDVLRYSWPGSRDLGGWYCTADDTGSTYTGHVWQLPARDGTPQYVAGYVESEDTGYVVLSVSGNGLELFDDKEEAARAANELARVNAESDREADEQWREAQHVDEARDDARREMKQARQEARRVIAALRELRALNRPSDARAVLLDVLAKTRDEMRQCIRRIAEHTDTLATMNHGDFPA